MIKLTEIYNHVITESGWIDEALLGEEYPTTWSADEFSKLRTFRDRIKYAERNLQRLVSGSGRIVYKIDSERVLKLSKNAKGVAQTKTEIEWGNDWFLKNLQILAEIFSYDTDGLWVEMELARKLTALDFKRIVGVDFTVFGDWLVRQYGRNRGYGDVSDDDNRRLSESEFAQSVMEFMLSYRTPVGDLIRKSSYGIVQDDKIVIVDYGLSGEVYDSYYS